MHRSSKPAPNNPSHISWPPLLILRSPSEVPHPLPAPKNPSHLMATITINDPNRLSKCPIPFKSIDENAETGSSPPRRPTDYDELISGLPANRGPYPARNYQGFWWPEGTLPGVIAFQRHFTPRTDDLFLASYPKSGTTWLKALAFATTARARYPPTSANHPLLRLNPHDCVAYVDAVFAAGKAHKIEALPSPRLLQTHLPYSLLPDSVATSSDCRVVYVCRDPKDSLVSRFHFVGEVRPGAAEDFNTCFDQLCEGTNNYGPIWDHVLGYWKESLRRPHKVLFLKYEEMLEDPVANVRRLAEFVGCPFSAQEVEEGLVEEIIGLCSFDKLKSLEVNKTGARQVLIKIKNSSYFRKGAVGDWRNHMSLEMAKRFDDIFLQNIEGSGLALPGVHGLIS